MSKKSIYEALAAAQAKIGGIVAKNANNPHFRSSYADLSAVTAVAIPALTEQGISVIVETELDNGLLTVRTILALSQEERVHIDVPVPLGQKGGAQAFGSAMTYGRRYGLSALCGIAQADDDGHEAQASAPSGYQQPQRQQAAAQQQQAPQEPVQQQAPEPVSQAAGGVLEKVLKGVEGCESLERLDAATAFAHAQLQGVELKVALKAIEEQRSKISA